MIQFSQVLTPNLPLAVSNSPEHTWSWSRDPRAEDVKLPKRTHAQGRVAHRAGRAPLPYLSPHDDARVLIGWEDKTEGEPALLIPPSQPLPHWPLNQASQHTVDIRSPGAFPSCLQLLGSPMGGCPICVHREQFLES